ncbi:MAG: hypothetical protein H7Z16_12010 [Pyrinomonadaceae bacterium]|nr:hypothetical protein [Pyrinomonadaceae bacterium]
MIITTLPQSSQRSAGSAGILPANASAAREDLSVVEGNERPVRADALIADRMSALPAKVDKIYIGG